MYSVALPRPPQPPRVYTPAYTSTSAYSPKLRRRRNVPRSLASPKERRRAAARGGTKDAEKDEEEAPSPAQWGLVCSRRARPSSAGPLVGLANTTASATRGLISAEDQGRRGASRALLYLLPASPALERPRVLLAVVSAGRSPIVPPITGLFHRP
jgi:hypothetical protein